MLYRFVIVIALIIFQYPIFAQQASVVLFNPMHEKRDSELIVLHRSWLEKKAFLSADDQYLSITTSDHRPLNVQLDDIDNDGRWDEAAFLYSFKPDEKVLVFIKGAKELPLMHSPTLAHVRMKLRQSDNTFGPSVAHAEMPFRNPPNDFSKNALPPYLTEGPGWENDKVAFRLYFDTRNAKDIYGKRVAGMVMDTVGANKLNSYHKYSDWGMDILMVGKSLGSGGLAFAYNANGKDTLVRLGGADIKKETFTQIADGPIRAVFKMEYEWELNHKPVKVTEYTSIWGGQYFYQSKVVIDGNIPTDLKLNIGLPDFHENVVDSFTTAKAAVLYNFGKQSENNDNLGMGIITAQNNFSKYWAIGKDTVPFSDIKDTYLSEVKLNGSFPVIYRYYACWSKTDARFDDKKYFEEFIKKESEKFSAPIIIR